MARSRPQKRGRNEVSKKPSCSNSTSSSPSPPPTKRTKKWTFLEHSGPLFSPPFTRLPKNVNLKYNRRVVKLSKDAEEIACFYARLIDHEHTKKRVFNENFFEDWRDSMTSSEKSLIRELRLCDFRQINKHFKQQAEARKNISKEEKLRLKQDREEIAEDYGYCDLDGHEEKIANFRVEPPGLFLGRGDHPKAGKVKQRVYPEDVIINCSEDSETPEPPEGHEWKEIRHDNTVTWLACWEENVQGTMKYVQLNQSSRLKSERDWLKYEKARELGENIDEIRQNYRHEMKSKNMKVKQRAVALYFIDKLSLRAGNEKDEDQADTVGCCSLRVEHIELCDEEDEQETVVRFDFLGKDSIRYENEVQVNRRTFESLKCFIQKKKPEHELFDKLTAPQLNNHLNKLMDGLTAKVFRTYNASSTLEEKLEELTPIKKGATVADKLLAYNRANRVVAILCNHQRAVPKTHKQSMETLVSKIKTKKQEIQSLQKEIKRMKKSDKRYKKKGENLKRLEEQFKKLEMNKTDKEEGKKIALGTSKLNYLDPRISVAWCKKHDVPIEKIYNKTQRAKFSWAIDMADEDFRFN